MGVGVPQGSVLGPVLFTLLTDEILRELQLDGTLALMYVDDLVVSAEGDTLRDAVAKAQEALRCVEVWCERTNMKLSPSKSFAQYCGPHDIPDSHLRGWPLDIGKSIEVKIKDLAEFRGSLHPETLVVRHDAKLGALAGTRITAGAGIIVRGHRGDPDPFLKQLNNDSIVCAQPVLQWVRTTRYLGVLIEGQLNMEQHVQSLERSHRRKLGVMSKIAGKNWGCADADLLFRAYVEPAVSYCLGAIGRFISPQLITRIEGLHRDAVAIVAGLDRRANIDVGLEEAGQLRHVRDMIVQGEAACADRLLRTARLRSLQPAWDAVKQFLQMLPASTRTIIDADKPRLPSLVSPVMPWIEVGCDIHLTVDGSARHDGDEAVRKARASIDDAHSNADSVIFTDGSKTGYFAGAGVYVSKRPADATRRYSLWCPKYSTVMYSEMHAIAFALQVAMRSKVMKLVVIFSDSQSSLSALRRGHTRQLTNIGKIIWSRIASLQARGCTVELRWVPSHLGIAENEVADELASHASKEQARESVPAKSPRLDAYTGEVDGARAAAPLPRPENTATQLQRLVGHHRRPPYLF
jgi:ribonuclease HI